MRATILKRWHVIEVLAMTSAIASIYVLDTQWKIVLQGAFFILIVISLIANYGLNRIEHRASLPMTLPVLLMFGALVGFAISTTIYVFENELNKNELAVYFIQGILPFFLLPYPMCYKLMWAGLGVSTAFAIVDAGANVLSLLGYLDLGTEIRLIDNELRFGYPGLSGNTHAAGLFAFFAVLFLSFLIAEAIERRLWQRVAFLVPLGILVAISIHFIGARRYEGLAIIGCSYIMLLRWSKNISAVVLLPVIAAIFLYLTFSAPYYDYGNDLRRRLLENGFRQIPEHLFIGNGPTYLDLRDVTSDFGLLSSLGVTESQLIDLSLSYGALSASLFLLATLVCLGSVNRERSTILPITIVMLLGAELFFGGVIRGLPGATIFFSSFGMLASQNSARGVAAGEKS